MQFISNKALIPALALGLISGVVANDANALTFYDSQSPTFAGGYVGNDDGQGAYDWVSIEIAIDDLKYITTYSSNWDMWDVTPNMVGSHTAVLEFAAIYEVTQLYPNWGAWFGANIDNNFFEAEHGGMSYDIWVNTLPFTELDVTVSGPSVQASASYTLGTASPVPEPASILLFGSGIAGLVGNRLRRKKKA